MHQTIIDHWSFIDGKEGRETITYINSFFFRKHCKPVARIKNERNSKRGMRKILRRKRRILIEIQSRVSLRNLTSLTYGWRYKTFPGKPNFQGTKPLIWDAREKKTAETRREFTHKCKTNNMYQIKIKQRHTMTRWRKGTANGTYCNNAKFLAFNVEIPGLKKSLPPSLANAKIKCKV